MPSDVVPQAPDTEADVLGTVLLEGAQWWRAVEREGGEDFADLFWDPDLRLVATTCAAVVATGAALSTAHVADALLGDVRADALAPSVATFLASLQGRARIRSVADLQSSVRVLADKRALRGYLVGLDSVRAAASEAGAAPMEVAGALRELSLTGGAGEDVELVDDIVAALEAQRSIRAPWRAPTGIPDLDKALRGGFEPGRIYFIGARAKVGKSTFAINAALEALVADVAVLFISLEMNPAEMWSKMLSAQSYVEQSRIKDWVDGISELDSFDPDEAARLTSASAELRAANLFLAFSSQVRGGADSVVSLIMSVQGKLPTGAPLVVFVDYVQLIVRNHQEVRAEVSDATRKWKLAAQDLGVAIVSPAQINRAGAGAGALPGSEQEGMPMPHHLKDSGSLEQDADAVILLNRPHVQDEDQPAHVMDIWLALNRTGPSVRTKAFYSGEHSTIRDLDADGAGPAAPPPADAEEEAVRAGARRSYRSREAEQTPREIDSAARGLSDDDDEAPARPRRRRRVAEDEQDE